jgi:hypothetical protein
VVGHVSWTEVGEQGEGDISGHTCTFASQWIRHRYFQADTHDTAVVKGAPKDADWEIRPEPDFRASRPKTLGSSDFDPRHEYCLIHGHVFGSALSSDDKRCDPAYRVDNLDPGLHGPLLERDNDSDTDRALGIQDLTNGGSGAWVFNPMWIKPNGSIVSKTAGGRGINPEIRLHGRGECYWHAPIWWSGKKESSTCGSCNTVYQNRHIYTGACALLDQTCIKRRVWEEGTFGTTELSGYAVGDFAECVDFSGHPWVCGSRPATTLDGNCEPPGPPPLVPPKTYHGGHGDADMGGGNLNSTNYDA